MFACVVHGGCVLTKASHVWTPWGGIVFDDRLKGLLSPKSDGLCYDSSWKKAPSYFCTSILLDRKCGKRSNKLVLRYSQVTMPMPFQIKSDKDCVADSGLPVFGFAPRLHIVTWYSERAHKLLTRQGMWEMLEFAIVSCIRMPFISKAASWPR